MDKFCDFGVHACVAFIVGSIALIVGSIAFLFVRSVITGTF